MTADDGEYLKTILDSVRVCTTYRPKFGQGGRTGLTFLDFQELYRGDPFYSWFGLDNPMAAHKTAGRAFTGKSASAAKECSSKSCRMRSACRRRTSSGPTKRLRQPENPQTGP